MSPRLPLAVFALSLLAAFPAAAYNALKNGDFNGGITPWNISGSGGGFGGSESYFGSPAGGSLRLQSSAANATAHADQCVDTSKWFVFDFSARKFNNAEGNGGTHPFKVDFYDGADCGGNIVDTITLPEAGTSVSGNPLTGWIEVSVLGTAVSADAISAKVSLDAVAGPTGYSYYLMDNVLLIPTDEIFPDNFD